jgi:tetratricopeptide (TPR) repeat protein
MDKLKNLILTGDFQSAKILTKNMDSNRFGDLILKIAFDEGNLCSYTFISYLLLEEESSELHYLASEVLALAFCHLEGAYASALYHARRAATLSPEDVSYLEYLLFFHEIPEKLIDKEEAIQIAKKIIESDPENLAAKRVLGNQGLC